MCESMDFDLRLKINDWFITGEVGQSSKAMAAAAMGHVGLTDHPYDAADLNRCIKLLIAVPEIRNKMDRIAKISDVWARFVKHWDLLEQTFIDEAGLDWCKQYSAVKTWELMVLIREDAEII